MPTEERCVPTLAGGDCVAQVKSALTKQRYVELVQLGKIVSEKLMENGLKRHEFCEFGRIMEKIMQLE
jgi:hypothetical protein